MWLFASRGQRRHTQKDCLMTCEHCRLWSQPKGSTGPYGWCKPSPAMLPFWAARHQTDMQTQTLRTEGGDCDAFLPRGAA